MGTEFDEYDFLGKDTETKPEQANGNAAPGRSLEERLHREHKSSRDRDGTRDRHRDRDSHRDREDPDRRDKHRSSSRDHRSHKSSRHRDERDHRSSRDRDRPRDDMRDRHREDPRGQEAYKRPRMQEFVPRPAPPRPAPREVTPPEVRAAREREKELAELDRDIRTVFAYNLNLKAEEKDLFQFFSTAGKVLDVRIISDRNTRRSKGFAYIEYARREDIVNAMALTGQFLMGQAVMVKSSEAEKNLAWEAAQQQAQAQAQLNAMGAQAGSGPCKLLVTNLNVQLAEGDVRQLFAPFGQITSVSIMKDNNGQSQGYGYVEFSSMPDASKAMQQWDGQEVVGQKLSVKVANMGPASIMPQLDLDDDEGEHGGLKLTANARSALMNRLAGAPAGSGANTVPVGGSNPFVQGTGLPGPPGASTQSAIQWQNPNLQHDQGVLGPKSPIPTQCLLLKNMFNPDDETDPNWDLDIGNDVKDESEKYGQVVHHYVDKNSKGFVYLKFLNGDGASKAQAALNGRWFAGRQIAADFQFPAVYNNYFCL
ncbi:hypothetical protein ABBQ32_009168 [Trebouxia sp. C0010 RCD-2024]